MVIVKAQVITFRVPWLWLGYGRGLALGLAMIIVGFIRILLIRVVTWRELLC